MAVEVDQDPAFPDADPEAVARRILLRRLTDQPRSRAELAEALAKRRVPVDVATQLLDRFTEVGLIDDEAFARAWVESRMRGKGLARRALALELHRKGIDVGVETGLVRKAGAWYTYEGDQLGQGKENSRAFLRDNPDLADEIEKRIKEKLGVGPKVNEPPAANIDF